MPIPYQEYDHLWIVISDPSTHQGAFVIVNLTKDKNRAGNECLVSPGDHPWIKDKCFVNFADAMEITAEKTAYLELLVGKQITMQAEMEVKVLERIRTAARASKALPIAYRKYF